VCGWYPFLCIPALRRRAQRKFRERQKQKLAESEERARELERALDRMRLEKSTLEMRNALLEKIVAMRDGGGGGPPGALPPALPPGGAQGPRQGGRRSSGDSSVSAPAQTVELSVRNGEGAAALLGPGAQRSQRTLGSCEWE
jgi:hypothetical protein